MRSAEEVLDALTTAECIDDWGLVSREKQIALLEQWRAERFDQDEHIERLEERDDALAGVHAELEADRDRLARDLEACQEEAAVLTSGADLHRQAIDQLTRERDAARREYEVTVREIAEADATIERLTVERDDLQTKLDAGIAEAQRLRTFVPVHGATSGQLGDMIEILGGKP